MISALNGLDDIRKPIEAAIDPVVVLVVLSQGFS
mgnify:FL=1